MLRVKSIYVEKDALRANRYVVKCDLTLILLLSILKEGEAKIKWVVRIPSNTLRALDSNTYIEHLF